MNWLALATSATSLTLGLAFAAPVLAQPNSGDTQTSGTSNFVVSHQKPNCRRVCPRCFRRPCPPCRWQCYPPRHPHPHPHPHPSPYPHPHPHPQPSF